MGDSGDTNYHYTIASQLFVLVLFLAVSKDEGVKSKDIRIHRRNKKNYSKYQNCDRWAVIVGISQYKYQPWNLNYVHRDAEKLYQLLYL